MIALAGKHYLAGLVWVILLGIVYLVIDNQIKAEGGDRRRQCGRGGDSAFS